MGQVKKSLNKDNAEWYGHNTWYPKSTTPTEYICCTKFKRNQQVPVVTQLQLYVLESGLDSSMYYIYSLGSLIAL